MGNSLHPTFRAGMSLQRDEVFLWAIFSWEPLLHRKDGQPLRVQV
jgi:hypothetical protein